MSQTFANTIDGNQLYAARAVADAAGNDIQATYATKSEIVNADWDAVSGSPGYIENKPVIPAAQVNADWDAVSGISEILNKPAIPSGVQLVPAATSADADKVLTVDAQGVPGWAVGGGGSNVFMATSTTTFPELWQAFHEEGKIVYCTAGSASSLTTPYFLQTLKSNDSGHTTGTATFVQFNRYSTGRIEAYYSTVTFNSNHPTLGTVTFTRQIVIPDNPGSHVGEYLTAQSNGNMTFATVNQVPASTSADADKVLTVDSQGTPAWSTPAAGGVTDVEVDGTSVVSGGVASITMPTVDQTYDATSTNAQSGVAVASAIASAGLFQATYGVTTYAEIDAAYQAHKIVYCYKAGGAGINGGRLAFLAYANPGYNYEFQYYRSDNNGGDDSVFIYKVTVSNSWSETSRNVQKPADWNAASGPTSILNKPTIPSGVELVPAATSADADKVLTVDGQGVPGWAVVPAQSTGLFQAEYGTTSYADIVQAINDKKIVYCRLNSGASRMAFLAYIGSSNVEFQYYRSLSSHSASNMTDEVYVYTVSSSGWTTTTRKTGVKVMAGTHMSQSYSNDTLTLNCTWPDVDQTYDASSANAQSGVAVASAIAGVNAVPASTSSDADKVLTVDAQGTPGWAPVSLGDVNNVLQVNALPATTDPSTLYLIPET